MEETVARKELKRALMRDSDKPPQTRWQIERDREKIASQRQRQKDKEQARVSKKKKKT